MDEVDAVYSCGLEIEDPTGPVVVEFLERACAGKQLYFTPGPRPESLPMDLVERIYDLHPQLHMNADEACVAAARLTGEADAFARGGAADGGAAGVDQAVVRAVAVLQKRVGNTVFATMGPDGCYSIAGRAPRRGAGRGDGGGHHRRGDSHIGALMSGGTAASRSRAPDAREPRGICGGGRVRRDLPRERVAEAAGY